ncbi:MAG: redox-regulated ATPase YchF [Bacteroidota bacterium]|nr:redox-regulated ATPase YchF [Bacteroidota bacterium]
MSLKCGIVGLPNVGKSTLFNCLSNSKAESANFPFCTIEPNIGVIIVPDERLNKLADLVGPEKIIPTTVDIVDIAGLVKGANKGEGLGNKFLANIRETDAIIHVLRCFDDENITHVNGSVNPVRDKEIIDMELQLKDLETLEKKRDQYFKIAKSGNKDSQYVLECLEMYISYIKSGNFARSISSTDEQKKIVDELQLLTNKPVIYVCNVDENSVKHGNKYVDSIYESIKNEDAEVLIIASAIEAEISELDNLEEQLLFLSEMGLEKPGIYSLINATYKLLNLKTYFTAGKKEVRAWTIIDGMKAPAAAGVIHSDFEKGFIRAEVIAFKDFINLGSEKICKEAGKLSIEGKDYIVRDGDIIHFRFNV